MAAMGTDHLRGSCMRIRGLLAAALLLSLIEPHVTGLLTPARVRASVDDAGSDEKSGGPLRVSEMYIDGNNLRRAVFVDSPSPTFSWELDCRSQDAPKKGTGVACPRGTEQTSYRLRIFSARTKALVVDTRVVDSRVPSVALGQGLTSLKASTKYTFELSVWASQDKRRWPLTRAPNAKAQGQFHTALFSPAEWSAEWISGGTMLRSAPFSTRNNTMISALLLASGVGCYSLTINGLNVDTAYPTSRMDPGFSTAPRARLLVSTSTHTQPAGGGDGEGERGRG